MPNDLASIAAAFAIAPPIGPIAPLGGGLINQTYRVESGSGAYVLQRINRQVFPDPEAIMANLAVLSDHLAGRDGLRVPALVPTRAGRAWLRDRHGEVWRLMELIADAVTLTELATPRQAAETGAALGRFHRLTRDLDPDRLAVALPGFHRTPRYLARLREVRRTPGDAAADALAEALLARAALADRLEESLAAGRIGLRTIHGDPKLDNILFHRENGRALALIDLDTVQPGLIQHDLGDCLRSCCNRQGESPDGAARTCFDLGLCADILAAYAAETRDVLGRGDVETFYDAIRLMPYELAMRFLTDHLEGDRYFRVTARGQNLAKAGVQFDLLLDIESQETEIRNLIARLFATAGDASQTRPAPEKTA